MRRSISDLSCLSQPDNFPISESQHIYFDNICRSSFFKVSESREFFSRVLGTSRLVVAFFLHCICFFSNPVAIYGFGNLERVSRNTGLLAINASLDTMI